MATAKHEKTEYTFDIDQIINALLNGNHLPRDTKIDLEYRDIEMLCNKCRKIFLEEPMVFNLQLPIKIVGSIHGNFYDLLEYFAIGGHPSEKNKYLFLGNMIDRGNQSIESLCLLFAYKIKYPNDIYLLRGNHEVASMTRVYGLFDECKKRYNIRIWKYFIDTFNCMSICGIINYTCNVNNDHDMNKNIFCVHGGISPDFKSLSQIKKMRKPYDIPDDGVMCDFVWSDPDKDIDTWGDGGRGVSYSFGYKMFEKFCEKFCQNDGLSVDILIRSHQVVDNGFEYAFNKEFKNKLITLFSSSYYCNYFDNIGAMLYVDSKCNFNIIHVPYYIPWNLERHIWIAFLKNQDNNKCFIQTLPKDVVYHILLFLRIKKLNKKPKPSDPTS